MANDDDPVGDELFGRTFALESSWTELEMSLEGRQIEQAAEDAIYLAVECGRFVRFVQSVSATRDAG